MLPRLPKVSVVIITRNRPQILSNCLDHLAQQSYTDFEIIVVDSSDNHISQQIVEQQADIQYYPIWDGRNNMPHARNLGLKHAQGEIVAFIDDDCLVSENWLGCLLNAYGNEKVGGVGGSIQDERLKYPHPEMRIGVILDDGNTIHNFSTNFQEQQVDWIAGGNMSYRRSILMEIGGFDPHYIGHNAYEDVDIAQRVRSAGYQVRFTPSAHLVHLGASRSKKVVSRNYESPRFLYYLAHNHAYFVLKNLNEHQAFIHHALHNLYTSAAYAIKKISFPGLIRTMSILAGFIVGSCRAIISHSSETSR